jgi:hypothetical protein
VLGKGAVVDLAAVVRDLEALTGKSYTTSYDLTFGSTEEELLNRYDWIEVSIQDAWEEVEVMEPVTETVFSYDLETLRVVQKEIPTGEDSEIGTGEYRRRLKEGVRFDRSDGKFYRPPTLAEIPQGAAPNVPVWIGERIAAAE